MKKTLSLILSAVLILSTLVSLIVPTSAEGEEKGNWDVMIPAHYSEQEDESKVPFIPGYYYDEEGYHTISPDYTDYNPEFTVISKETYDITNFSMTVVIHDYAVYGDNWLSFSVWSESNGLAQGDVSGKYGDGWTSLIRGVPTTGKLNKFESWNATKGGRRGDQVFTSIDGTQLNPVIFDEVINKDGDRVITFSIEEGVVKVNGTVIGAGTDYCIANRFPEGLAYIGVTLHNTDTSGNYQPTISITNVNGEVPTGSDSREPERRPCRPPYYPDIDEIPYGQPAIWFDATLSNTNTKMPQYAGCNLTYADDNKSFLVELEQDNFQIDFQISDEISYRAEDLTCFAIIFKNFCDCDIPEGETPFTYCDGYSGGESAKIWYYSGEDTAPHENGLMEIRDYIFCVNPVDKNGNSLVDDYYTVAIFEIDNPEYWQDRIHGFRLDVEGLTNYAKEGHGTMEILGAGFFRSPWESIEYIGNMSINSVENTSFNVNALTAAFWDCGTLGHYDAGNGDELCDAGWCATRRCDGCDRLVEFSPGDRCENCGYLEICDDKIHADEDMDNYCDFCYEIINPEEITTQPVEIPDTETETDSTNEDTDETTAKDNIYDDSDAPVITIAGCELSASLGIISIVSIIGAGIVIKKKED